jgi:hypothetical protein
MGEFTFPLKADFPLSELAGRLSSALLASPRTRVDAISK